MATMDMHVHCSGLPYITMDVHVSFNKLVNCKSCSRASGVKPNALGIYITNIPIANKG